MRTPTRPGQEPTAIASAAGRPQRMTAVGTTNRGRAGAAAPGQITTRPVRRDPLGSPLAPVVLGSLGCVLALTIWELASQLGAVPSADVPPPSTVLPTLAEELAGERFWVSIGHTLTQWAAGFGLSIVVAVPVGLLLGSNEATWRAFRPLVEFFRTVPGNALIPLAILLWGLSLQSVVFLTVFGCGWSLIVQTMYGVHDVEQEARNTAAAFRLSRLERVRWVILPSALPYIVTGLRIASSTALIIAVSAEILIGVPGIGQDIALTRTGGQVDRMYALILASGVVGIVIDVVFSRFERHFLRWHESQRRWAEK